MNSEVRYKARLFARGFLQREGIDYFETFALVIQYESVRILLAIAAKEDYEIMKFDVKTAFLYGNLQKDIYMQQPEDNIRDSIVYLALYVYDGLVMSKNINVNNKVIKYLQSNFQFTSDEANEYIGFEIERDCAKRTLIISQSKFIEKLIGRFGMSEAKPSSLPAEPELYMCKNPKNAKKNESGSVPYREAISALLSAARV